MTDTKTVYLNGSYLPLNEAKISVLDRGFLFGDGVYEVIPVYNRRPFHLTEHLQRLDNSLSEIGMQTLYSHRQWRRIFTPLLDRDHDQYIYLHITRGVAAHRDHAFPNDCRPTVFAMSSPIQHPANKSDGVKALTLDDIRWQLCHVKATTLLGNVLLRQQAVEQNCAEAILVKNGIVTEGAASNLFAVFAGILLTPPQDKRILPGITRNIILDIARQNGIPAKESEIPLKKLKTADEIWLTSSTREILPVVELDNIPVANGKAGPMWHTMQQLFQQYKNSLS